MDLNDILIQFVESGWELICIPAKHYLADQSLENKECLIEAIEEANLVCGSCGCEFDSLYKIALELLNK